MNSLQDGNENSSVATDNRLPSANGFKLPHHLTAFKHRNYRLFFFGQIISLTGTWLQNIAQAWLVLQLTTIDNRALMLGISGAISALPFLLFSLPAGLFADRFKKRNILVVTQITAMVLAFVLAALTHFQIVTIYHIILLGFMLGTVNAFDAPTRQSFVAEMVGKEDLANAITLNSAMFNGARIIGPAVAGLAIAAVGVAGAFTLNGISFIAVIIGLLMMNMKQLHTAPHRGNGNVLAEGFQYVKSNKLISALLILTAITSIFASSYMILMPIFANDILKLGAKEFGYLMAAAGIGALCGAFTLSSLGNFNYKGKMLLIGNITYCIMLVLFSYSRSFHLSVICLMIAGWGMMMNMALINTIIQATVPDHLRGRIMSYYTLMFLGTAPIGNFVSGFLAHWFSAPFAVRAGAVLCVISAVILSPRFLNHGQQLGENNS
ncbi:MAG: MFS transporter [Armatimonadota bacterium]